MPGYMNDWKHENKNIDWDGVSVAAPKPPPAGLYDLKLIEVQLTETKGGPGKTVEPMIKVRAEIVKAHDSANEEAIGRTVFDNWVMSQAGAFKVKNAAIVAGKDLPPSLGYDDLTAFASSFEGEIITAMLDQRTFEGKTNANVRYYGEEAPTDEQNGGEQQESHPPRKVNGKSKPAARGQRR